MSIGGEEGYCLDTRLFCLEHRIEETHSYRRNGLLRNPTLPRTGKWSKGERKVRGPVSFFTKDWDHWVVCPAPAFLICIFVKVGHVLQSDPPQNYVFHILILLPFL